MEEGVEEGLAIPKNAQKPLLEVVEISEKEIAAFQGPVAAGNKVAVPTWNGLIPATTLKS